MVLFQLKFLFWFFIILKSVSLYILRIQNFAIVSKSAWVIDIREIKKGCSKILEIFATS